MSNGIYDYVDDVKERLAEKDKQIAELKAKNQQLQQQLKEKDEQLEAFNTLLSCGTYTTPNTDIWLILIKQNTQQVCEKIKKHIFNHFNVKNMEEYENLSLIDSLFTADVVIEMLDTILKEYQK